MTITIGGEKVEDVIGTRCSVDFNLDFDIIANRFDVPIEEVQRLWNEEELTDFLIERLSVTEIIALAVGEDGDLGIDFNAGNGYTEYGK